MRILVLEDEDSIRRMIALVQARGFEVVGVSTGVKAVDEALQRAPDVAILDLMVPGAFDGFEVCRRLRAHTATANMPIIIISALDTRVSPQGHRGRRDHVFRGSCSPPSRSSRSSRR